ncbi:MAG: lysophospholipid acyltransferase family protein [Myxococcota bacterium]|nr:lysophospholipid acyltransferase family protein [Myxococcota bacterium]
MQREIGRLLAPIWIPIAVFVMRFGWRYRIHDLEAVRAKYAEIRAESSSPLLVCANHLTMVDSFLVAWALAPTWRYCLHFNELSWNVPERTNFASSLGERVSAWVMKCIPITRGGPRGEVARVLDRLAALLRHGEMALIFPEGRRSRSGRVEVDNAAWGVGRIVGVLPGCRVLCVYLRGRRQETWSQAPARGDLLDVEIECIEPKSDARGLRRSRDFSRQIVAQLASMEREYFNGRQ